MNKIKVGILGATGLVGQRLVSLLDNHPFFSVVLVAASPQSAGKSYKEVVSNKWSLKDKMPAYVKDLIIYDVKDIKKIASQVEMVFCAVNMPKEEVRELETLYAKNDIVVISNNSANRSVSDIPMIIPEINALHLEAIKKQKERLGSKKGFIVVKPNCSIQGYILPITPLLKYEPTEIVVSTYQAISGAGKTFETFKEIEDNVIPFIKGEEEKSEIEPLKIWGSINDGLIVPCKNVKITSQCVRVPVSDGHLVTAFVRFKKKVSKEEILKLWDLYDPLKEYDLPSYEKPLIYFKEDDRPQTRIDRDNNGGMGISIGRLREDNIFDYKFVALSHNTIRGAAGGSILTAELLYRLGYLNN